MEITTSIHGRLVGLGTRGNRNPLIMPDGMVSGRHGSQFDHSAPSRAVQFDDFNGKAISGIWDVQKGSDGSAVNFAVNAQVSGVVRGVTGAGAGVSMAANGVQLSSALNWKATSGNLVFEARVNAALITSLSLFIGFTNQVASLQMPVNSAASANTLTYNAADAVGFLFDTSNTDAVWFLVGNANSVAATAQVLSAANLPSGAIAPVAATFATFRIELDSSGNARFFYNGNAVGTAMSGAVTAATALSPVIAGFRRTATITQIDVDYIHVAADRV